MTNDKLRELLQAYKPSTSATELVERAKLVLLVGISGAGKDTLKQRLLEQPGFYNFISYTTRAPRSNQGIVEKDGEDYYFISRETATEMLEKGEFIEAKEYSANVYGTVANGLLKSIEEGTIAVNDVEVQGVSEYKNISDNVQAIFVLPPSYDEWQRRLTSRYKKSEIASDNIELRQSTASKELRFALEQGYFDFVINDNVEDALNKVKAIASGVHDPVEQQRGIECAKNLLRDISTH